MRSQTVHASCVLLGDSGVLLRGASGSGKSTLGDGLVFRALQSGAPARHVADDRVCLIARGGAVFASPPKSLAGLWERAGQGIVRVDYALHARICLVVDLTPHDQLERMPPTASLLSVIEGVSVPRMILPVRELELSCLRIGQMVYEREKFQFDADFKE